jgi:release factor glutamine methyltransferase
MLKVLEAIELSADYLKKKGIEEARLNAELMLADILGMKRLNLYLNFDRPLSENEKELYREYLTRRSKFEPLQYILGYTEFFGLKIFVNQNVLIPRPETELLVETIIKHYKSDSAMSILDIGTGSGAISIALAKNLNCNITAIDISTKALETARYNADFNNVLDKIQFKEVDILNHTFDLPKYDIIVSNPPYVSKDEYLTLQNEIKNFEPLIAVTDNFDGLLFYKKISEFGKLHLNNNGKLFFELGKGQFDAVKSIMQEKGYSNIEIVKDYSNIERIIVGDIL